MSTRSPYKSEGDGTFTRSQFHSIGKDVVLEKGVLVFHPENVIIENNVYIGHNTIIKGYHQNLLVIGENTWIGPRCFLHSAGGLRIGRNVGVGPDVRIITSYHKDPGINVPLFLGEIALKAVTIGDDSDIGVASVILPGISIGQGVQVGAGSVVTRDIANHAVAAGNPAKIIRHRHEPSD